MARPTHLVEIADMPGDMQMIQVISIWKFAQRSRYSKTMEEFTAQTKHIYQKAKEEIDNIPARIEELKEKPTSYQVLRKV
jgi:cysteinyl-tRNA synthetase